MENTLHYLHCAPRFACLFKVTCIDIHLCAPERRLKIWRRLLKKSHVRIFQKSAPNFQTAFWAAQMNIYTCRHA